MSVTRRNVSFAPDVWAHLEKIGEVSPVVDRALRKYLGLPDAPPPDRGANLRKVTRAEVLAAVAQHGSQAAAAHALGVHESTVSRHVRDAEENRPVPLAPADTPS